MDPNVTLGRIGELCELLADANIRELGLEDEAAELVELVAALDEWLSRGGFLPRAWDRARP